MKQKLVSTAYKNLKKSIYWNLFSITININFCKYYKLIE